MKIKFVFLFFIIVIKSSFAQLNINYNLMSNIEEKIQLKYGNNISLLNYFEIDSLVINNSDYALAHKVFDPNNLLQGITVFCAMTTLPTNEKKGLVGLFKNRDIIWDSDTSINCNGANMLYLFSVNDLDKNGETEISFTREEWGAQVGTNRLYVYSWDGTNGKLISKLSTQEISEIATLTNIGHFEFIDADGDGIYEIRGLWYSSADDTLETLVTYYFNGVNYLFNPGAFQPQSTDFLPRNNIDAKINTNVSDIDSHYVYHYFILNQIGSVQQINAIYFERKTDSLIVIHARNNWQNYNFFNLLGFENHSIVNNVFPTNFIKQNEPDSSFLISSYTPPTIIKFYLRGYNKIPLDTAITFEDIYNDILLNSFTGYTLGPSKIDSFFVPLSFLYTLLNYTTQSLQFGWVKNQATADKYANYFNTAKTQLQQNNIAAVTSTLNQVLQDVEQDSSANLTSEAYALIKYNTEYLKDNLPQENLPSLFVKLINSNGNLLTGGSLQYYEGSWKDAISYGGGTFGVNTDRPTISLSMTYEGASQTIHNVPIGSDTAVFQTVNVSVQLQNSHGNLIDTGTVQFYAGSWRDFGTTVNGTAQKELLPKEYSFSMSYEGAGINKQQDISANPTVVFQTVNATVQLKNSQGNLIDTGIVQYYAGSWRNFGTTVNGTVQKELLPKDYSFSMTYEGVSINKQQDLNSNSTVVFSTVLCSVKVSDSQGQPINGANVSYYSGAWRQLGQTVNGQVTKEILPKNLTFSAEYNGQSQNKTQDISINNVVEIVLP